MAITNARVDLVNEAVLEDGEVAVPALINPEPIAVPSLEFGEAMMVKEAIRQYGSFDGYIIARRIDVVKPLVLTEKCDVNKLKTTALFDGASISSLEDVIRLLAELSVLIDEPTWWKIHNELTDNMNTYLKNELLVNYKMDSIYEDAKGLAAFLRTEYGSDSEVLAAVINSVNRVAARVFNFVDAGDTVKNYFSWDITTEKVEEVTEVEVDAEGVAETVENTETITLVPNMVCRASKYAIVVLPWVASAMGIDEMPERGMKVSSASNPVLAEAIKNVLSLAKDNSVQTILVTADHERYCVAKSPLVDSTYFVYPA